MATTEIYPEVWWFVSSDAVPAIDDWQSGFAYRRACASLDHCVRTAERPSGCSVIARATPVTEARMVPRTV